MANLYILPDSWLIALILWTFLSLWQRSPSLFITRAPFLLFKIPGRDWWKGLCSCCFS